MILRLIAGAAMALALATGARAAETFEPETQNVPFSFEGLFGSFDEHQLQRGLQVYTEVCSACHGLKFVPIRTLGDEGGPRLPEDQVRAYAAKYDVFDPELNDTRPGRPGGSLPALEPCQRAGPVADGQGPRGVRGALRPRHQPADARHGRAGAHLFCPDRLHRRDQGRGRCDLLPEQGLFDRLDRDAPAPVGRAGDVRGRVGRFGAREWPRT